LHGPTIQYSDVIHTCSSVEYDCLEVQAVLTQAMDAKQYGEGETLVKNLQFNLGLKYKRL